MPELWIPSGTGHSDFTEKKSRFIGEAARIERADGARARIKQLRLEHPRSRHVAWAYVLGKDAALRGMSDDGEPRGTAGRPIMDPITGQHLTDILVTVVRYFGGVKLGTGGLTSAYGKSSQDALAVMPRVLLVERTRVELETSYPVYEQSVRLIREAGGLIDKEVFESRVKIIVDLPLAALDDFHLKLKDLSRGDADFEVIKNDIYRSS